MKQAPMKTAIVLAMHGAPPRDFPQGEATEFLGLHARMDHAAGAERAALAQRHAELDAKMRTWPRTAENDPFYVGALKLAEHLRRATGCEVITGFNEFCGPSLDTALDQAAALTPKHIILLTAMMTGGGEHAEVDIPAAVRRAQERHPGVDITYAWPFDASEVAQFLATQVAKFFGEPMPRKT